MNSDLQGMQRIGSFLRLKAGGPSTETLGITHNDSVRVQNCNQPHYVPRIEIERAIQKAKEAANHNVDCKMYRSNDGCASKVAFDNLQKTLL